MCGIVGIAGNLNYKIGKAFRDLLLFDTVRGIDSTGVLSVPLKVGANTSLPTIEKEVGLPDALWDNPKTKLFDFSSHIKAVPRVLLGHNRAATIGHITRDNAHPFRFENLYGVHNGTLRQYADLEGFKDHPIDSMCLLDTIQRKGIEHAWSNFIGAAAVVWWDDDEDTLNFARNQERPLYFAHNKNEDIIMWASEVWMIRIAAVRHGIELKKNSKDEDEVFYFTPDKHYSFRVNNMGYERLDTVTLKPKEYKSANFTSGYSVGYQEFRPTNNNKKGMLHSGWTKNMTRCGKETRGLRIEIRSHLQESNKFIGRFTDETGSYKGVIHVFPNTSEQSLQIQQAIKKGNNQFITTARMHCLDKGSWIMWGVSSQGLKPCATKVEIKSEEKPKPYLKALDGGKEKETDIRMFRSFQGAMVSEARWKELLSHGPGSDCSCAWCGENLEPKDHREILFLSKEDAICPECSANPMVLDNLGRMYPHISVTYCN